MHWGGLCRIAALTCVVEFICLWIRMMHTDLQNPTFRALTHNTLIMENLGIVIKVLYLIYSSIFRSPVMYIIEHSQYAFY